MRNHIYHKEWDEITYSLPNFKGEAAGIGE